VTKDELIDMYTKMVSFSFSILRERRGREERGARKEEGDRGKWERKV
jgi:hypothetical protein